MFTPQAYGNAARYITGSYPAAVSSVTPPARFLAGLVTTYNSLLGLSNLPVRRTNYYSGANQLPNVRLVTAGVVFVGIWGKNLAAFPINSDWTTYTTLT